MADAFCAANTVKPKAYALTPRIYKKILPEQVLILAAHFGLIPAMDDTTKARGVWVGRWLIDDKDRDEVLASLASVIDYIGQPSKRESKRSLNTKPNKWEERITRFRHRMGWKPIVLIRVLSHAPTEETAYKEFLQGLREDPRKAHLFDLDTQERAWKKFLQRLCERPDTYLEAIDDRTYTRIMKLRQLMATLAPEEFGTLPLDELAGSRRMPRVP